MRSLARDMGKALGSFGHISALRRLAVGQFRVESAFPLDFDALPSDIAGLTEHVLPIETVLDDIPALALTEEEARRMSSGQAIALWPVAKRSPLTGLEQGTIVQALCGDRLIAVAEVGNGMVRSVRVLNH